ncbi:hypothetical protein J4E83_001447 [Alternaria metachromatica]|uniref:uncharacterized protein n=1 Tax=Alternaria metachromatica TaxID=283354 RepID=UPI0020C25410|nr:uncharacterized protein J4E83_001447 [Alternaria metachromatica]KAI4636492.1 hypothetical protein J4E83_001447 [Alternaria metachromatica]
MVVHIDNKGSYSIEMGKKCKRYGKEQLLDMLQEQIPNAMAKIPRPDAFKFQSLPDGKSQLCIGTYIEGLSNPTTDEFWVHCGGIAKPWLAFDIGDKDQAFHGNAFFKKMTESGQVYLFSDGLKAIVAFVFVYCNKMEEFCDFQSGKGFNILVEKLRYMFPEVEESALSGNGTEDAGSVSAKISDADADVVKTLDDDQSAGEKPEEQLVKLLDDVLL